MLSGDLKGASSRRLNKQHRLVYEVIQERAKEYQGNPQVDTL